MLDIVSASPVANLPEKERQLPTRISLILCVLGLPGVIAMSWYVAQRLPRGYLPEWALPVIGGVQTSLLLVGAVILGAWLGPRVGLGAPLLQAVLQRKRLRSVWRNVWLPGVSAGVMGAAWMVTLAQLMPPDLLPGDPMQALPLWVRLLYGGISEELLARWGLMAMIMCGLWHLLQPRGGMPKAVVVWLAIALSSVIGSAGQLPAAIGLMGSLSMPLVAYVVISHAAYGLLAGFLFWRYGLEAAMLAHILALLLSHGLT